jgi:predicted Zn-dependent protease
MKEGDGGVNPPEFASTHPSYESRISKFDEWMPEAMDKLSRDGGERCSHVREEMKLARRHAAIEADRREKPSSV